MSRMCQPSDPHIFVVFHPHYFNFAALKWRSYKVFKERAHNLPDPTTPEQHALNQGSLDEWYAEGIVVVLFCALGFESLGYHVCHEWWGEGSSQNRYPRIGPANRLRLAIQDRYGVTMDENGLPFLQLKRLFEIRNNLVHRNSESNRDRRPINYTNAVAFRPEWAETAVEALQTVPAEIARLTGDQGFRREAEFIERAFAE